MNPSTRGKMRRFSHSFAAARRMSDGKKGLAVFTTRADTIMGITFAAVAPEHPLATEAAKGNPALAEFIEECKKGGVQEAELAEHAHALLAEALDVHRGATAEVFDPPCELERALGVRAVVRGVVAFAHERRLQRQIRVLEGLLPICAFCKSIRDQQGDWLQLEQYIQDRSEAKFSHGLCPRCVSEHYDDVSGQVLEELVVQHDAHQ